MMLLGPQGGRNRLEKGAQSLRLDRRRLLLGALSLGAGLAVPMRHVAAQSARPGERFRQVLLDKELGEAVYRNSYHLDMTAGGAVMQNKDGLLFIELQGQGFELIRRGLYRADDAMRRQGWLAMDWGIGQQRPDGGFGHNDDFHSTTIFLMGLGHALILDPSEATKPRLTALERGVDWVSHPRNSVRGMTRNLGFAHRFWLIAAMYDSAALLLNRTDLSRRATVFALDGARLQEPDGTNLEAGGYDVGYHMVGLVIASRYILTTSDPIGRDITMAMLPKGFDRHMLSIRPDGTISAEGATRVGKETGFGGTAKKVSALQAREGYHMAWRLLQNDKHRQQITRLHKE
jgi:hypothetical protein